MMEAKEVQKEETMVFDIEIKTDSEGKLLCRIAGRMEKINETY